MASPDKFSDAELAAEGIYVVESLHGHRRGAGAAAKEFKVRWKGYAPEDE